MNEFERAFDAFRSHNTPEAADVDRLQKRLDEEPPPRGYPWVLAAAILLGLAGASTFVGLRLAHAPPQLGDGTPTAPESPVPPASFELPLRESGELRASTLVQLRWAGEGDVSGAEQAPRIAWRQGTLDVEVVPERNVDLVVTTDEARVQVHGTVFSVTRDALGTAVAVTRGVVSVECAGGAAFRLAGGMSTTCGPVRAAALLRRARALQEKDPAAALADIDQALRDATRPLILDDELLALRVALLGRNGRNAEAVQAAVAYVRGGGARADEVARLGLALGAEGDDACALLAASARPCPIGSP